jgi:hypothetical protein
MITRRWFRPTLVLLAIATCVAGYGAGVGRSIEAEAQTPAGAPTFLRIATGGVNGTYYPMGGIIANAISSPPGSRSCESGGSCGVPNLIAVAVSSDGSVSNVRSIQSGSINSGFAQADVVFNAYHGTGAFTNFGPADKLRVVASLYAERLQLVARMGSDIYSMADLKGHRVSIDEPGSGTLLIARDLLAANGLAESDLVVEYLKPGPAASKILRDELDAFFIVAGVPTAAVEELVDGGQARIIPLEGLAIDDLLGRFQFLTEAPIPAETYKGQPEEIPTLGVVAQWVISADVPEELVKAICLALWNDATRTLLDGGHPTGRQIQLSRALDGVAIPLHPGAEACYRDLEAME